jgi:hypothetical protein
MRATPPSTSASAMESALLVVVVLRADLARQRLDARVELADRAHDVLRAALDLAGQVLHRVGHDAEAAARFTRALGLDARVESDEPRLQRDLRDLPGGTGHLAQRVDDARDLVADRLHRHARARHRLPAVLRLRADAVLRMRDLLQLLHQHEQRLRLACRHRLCVDDQATHLGGFAAEGRRLPGHRLHGAAAVDLRRVGHRRGGLGRGLVLLEERQHLAYSDIRWVTSRAASRAAWRSTGCAAGTHGFR